MEAGELTSIAAADLAEFYLGGRADGTIAVYNGALRKVWEHGRKLKVPLFLWGEGEVISLLVQMGRDGTTENAVKQAMACVNIVFEVMGKESPSKGALVAKVKISALKMRKEVAVRARNVWKLKDMKRFMENLYKKPATRVAAHERRSLVIQILLFFGMKRFNDVIRVRIKDLRFTKEGDLEVRVRRSKTDQEGQGSSFFLTGKRKSGFCIPEIVSWYIDSLGLSGEDYLFSRLRGSEGGEVSAIRKIAVSYSTASADLKAVLVKLRLPVVTMHGGRIGAATAAREVGVSKDHVRVCGGWKGDMVDSYVRPDKAGLVLSNALLDKF